MTLAGLNKTAIEVADSIRELSAHRYFLFQQAWAKELGIGSDFYARDGSFARLGLLLGQRDAEAALTEYNNALLAFTNLTSERPVNFLAEALAPLVTRIGREMCTDDTPAALAAVAGKLARLLTQAQLQEAVESSKKNFKPNVQ